MPGNASSTREQKYQTYSTMAGNPSVSKETKDAAWAEYEVALAADTGAQKASKKH